MGSLMIDLHNQLGGAGNVYTMDHRGTGPSTFLICMVAQTIAIGSPYGRKLIRCKYLIMHRTCSLSVEILLRFLSRVQLLMLLPSYSNGANTTLYGVSYDTYGFGGASYPS